MQVSGFGLGLVGKWWEEGGDKDGVTRTQSVQPFWSVALFSALTQKLTYPENKQAIQIIQHVEETRNGL